MARDDQLPFSRPLSKVNPRLHTPVWACIIVGALSAIPFIQFAGAAVIAVGATASIYFSYLLGNLAVLRARTKGWPRTRAPFKLGALGLIVNIVAVLWGAAMLLNFLTPSSASSAWHPETTSAANYLRVFSDPKPYQSDYYAEGVQLVDFKIDFLNKIPVIWTVFAAILIAGALYYWLAQKKKPWEKPALPQDEDLSGIVSSA
jgi:amino acid transporter